MQLKDYIFALGESWERATGRSLVALGGLIVNDGKFFGRLANGSRISLTSFEQCLAFFRDADNWPATVIPRDAAELLERLENIATEERAATGQGGDLSPEQQEAAE